MRARTHAHTRTCIYLWVLVWSPARQSGCVKGSWHWRWDAVTFLPAIALGSEISVLSGVLGSSQHWHLCNLPLLLGPFLALWKEIVSRYGGDNDRVHKIKNFCVVIMSYQEKPVLVLRDIWRFENSKSDSFKSSSHPSQCVYMHG